MVIRGKNNDYHSARAGTFQLALFSMGRKAYYSKIYVLTGLLMAIATGAWGNSSESCEDKWDDYVKDNTTNMMTAAVTEETCKANDGFVCKVRLGVQHDADDDDEKEVYSG